VIATDRTFPHETVNKTSASVHRFHLDLNARTGLAFRISRTMRSMSRTDSVDHVDYVRNAGFEPLGNTRARIWSGGYLDRSPVACPFPANKNRDPPLFAVEASQSPGRRSSMSTAVNPITAISTWSIDPAHSSVHFKVRHMMISNVRGEFRTVRGDLKLNDADITQSEIDIEIDPSSIHTSDEQRDAHLRSPDFLDTERHSLLTFRSTKVEKTGVDTLRVQGALTIHGVTRNVELDVDSISPATKDPWGKVRMAASAKTVISRKDFGLTWNAALETGGILVGDEVTIDLDVQFVKSQA